MKPSQHFCQVNGINLCWFEWGQASSNPNQPGNETILLLHATGFHARCWDQVIERLPGRHIIAVDLRGHGRSDHPVIEDWSVFAEDMRQFIEQLALKSFIGVGHSMGGHLLTLLAPLIDDRIQQLLLLDPVTLPPETYEDDFDQPFKWLDGNGVHPVAKRRNQFDDANALFENLRGRGSYASWDEEVLKDYCDHGVVPNPNGTGVVLACPPEVEASVYMTNLTANPYTDIAKVKSPVTIIRAKRAELINGVMDFTLSPTWPELVNHFPNATEQHFQEKTHFIPMDDPEFVASIISGMS